MRVSKKAASFTESVIRDMTRLAIKHNAINLAQGFPDFAAPAEIKEAAKRAIDAEMKPTVPWTWHDIRRSTASALAGLGVAVPVVEKILAHRSGVFRGVTGTYQRHSFIPEMRSALERWSEHLDRLVRGVPESKVVPIGRR